jgi:hypothetical protein
MQVVSDVEWLKRDMERTKVGEVQFANIVLLAETTTPAAPADGQVLIYAVDAGAGKTKLMALFHTGAAQQLAIEP